MTNKKNTSDTSNVINDDVDVSDKIENDSVASETDNDVEIIDAKIINDDENDNLEKSDSIEDDQEELNNIAQDDDSENIDIEQTVQNQTDAIAPPPINTKSPIPKLILGGVIAGLIGFALAIFTNPDLPFWADAKNYRIQSDKSISELNSKLEKLEGWTTQAQITLDNIPKPVDLSPILEHLNTLEERINNLEQTRADAISLIDPSSISSVIEAQVGQLRADLEAEKEKVSQMAFNAQKQQDAIEKSSKNALVRPVLALISASLTTGNSFTQSLSEFEIASGTTAPAALKQFASDGVSTAADLSQSFAAHARNALAQYRSENITEQGNNIITFFQSQLNARSVIPKEGTTPDAILSRAEAAAKDGRLYEALSELDSLPDIAREQMNDWVNMVKSYLDAHNAMDELILKYSN